MRAIYVLLILSCTCFAIPIHAQDCCEFNQPCRSGWRGICCDGSTVGAVVLGAGAGALAGWAASSGRGRRHCTIRHEDQLDKCQTLDLTYTLYANFIEGTKGLIDSQTFFATPFATLPNNEIILGKKVEITLQPEMPVGSLHISEVFFGKYQLGVLIDYTDITPLPEPILNVEVNSSRYGTANALASVLAAAALTEPGVIQELIAPYTYYPAKK